MSAETLVGLGWRPYRRVVVLWVRQALHEEDISDSGAAFLHADTGDYIGVDDCGFEHVLGPATMEMLEPITADDPWIDRALDVWGMLDLSEV